MTEPIYQAFCYVGNLSYPKHDWDLKGRCRRCSALCPQPERRKP